MAKTLEQLQTDAKQAADALARAQAALDAEAKAAAEPRAPEVVLTDLLEQIAMRLGNRPELRVLIAEYKGATKQATT